MSQSERDPSHVYQRRFGKRLRASRITAGYETYKDFAAAIGLHHETYRLYEAGLRQPKFHILAAISDKLDASLDFLILGRNGRPSVG